MDNSSWTKERGYHARDVHPTQDTPRMGTVNMRQEEETDTNNAREQVVRNLEESPKQDPSSAKDPTIELPIP